MDIKLILLGLVSIIVIVYLSVQASYSAKKGELRFGFFIKTIGLICLFISGVFLFIFFTKNYDVKKSGETIAFLGLIVGFGIPALYILLDAFFVKGSYDQESIFFSTPWTGKKKEKWNDLKSVTYNSSCSWYVLKFNNGKVIRISSYLGGSGYLMESIDQTLKNL